MVTKRNYILRYLFQCKKAHYCFFLGSYSDKSISFKFLFVWRFYLFMDVVLKVIFFDYNCNVIALHFENIVSHKKVKWLSAFQRNPKYPLIAWREHKAYIFEPFWIRGSYPPRNSLKNHRNCRHLCIRSEVLWKIYELERSSRKNFHIVNNRFFLCMTLLQLMRRRKRVGLDRTKLQKIGVLDRKSLNRVEILRKWTRRTIKTLKSITPHPKVSVKYLPSKKILIWNYNRFLTR